MSQRRRNPRTQQFDQELAEPVETGKQPSSAPLAYAVKRSKLGWQIRLDLKKACQQIALDDDMKDYEVLEMLLDEALAARAASKAEK